MHFNQSRIREIIGGLEMVDDSHIESKDLSENSAMSDYEKKQKQKLKGKKDLGEHSVGIGETQVVYESCRH